MATYFARVRTSDRAVVGCQHSPRDVPKAPEGFEHVEISETEFGKLSNLRHRDGGGVRFKHEGGSITETPDPRVVVTLSSDQPTINVDDTADAATIVVAAKQDGINYIGNLVLEFRSGVFSEIYKVNIERGKATLKFRPTFCGRYQPVSSEQALVTGTEIMVAHGG